MKQQASISEEKTAAASYILSFYQEVGNLTTAYAQYQNLMIQFDEQYAGQLEVKPTDEEQNLLKQTMQNIRFYVNKSYIQYRSIASNRGIKLSKDIQKNHQKINKGFIIERKALKEYTNSMNAFLVKNIMKKLLESSQEVVENIFKT